jgi:hypothetical protein
MSREPCCGVKALVLVALAACTSTRELASPSAALRTPGHNDGWVVQTTETWKERIDPNTGLRFKNANGDWSDEVPARSLHVDAAGAWVDRDEQLSQVANRVRITHIAPEVANRIASVRPDTGHVTYDDDGMILDAPAPELTRWLDNAELAVARLDPIERIPGADALDGDAVKLYALRYRKKGAPLGEWSLYSMSRGWLPPIHGTDILDALHGRLSTRLGWRWDQIANVKVTNISGGKTLGAMIGCAALSVALLPFALVGRGAGSIGNLSGGHAGGGGGGGIPPIGGDIGTDASPKGTWDPELPVDASSLHAKRLFTPLADVRAIVEPTLTFEGAMSRDMRSAGIDAKLRLGQVFEIGGAVREVEAMRVTSTTGAFVMGVHLPLDAGMHVALPLGFEVGGGGDIALDLRLPWGVRFNAKHWFATITPATPQYLHVHDTQGRWSLAHGLDLGVTF